MEKVARLSFLERYGSSNIQLKNSDNDVMYKYIALCITTNVFYIFFQVTGKFSIRLVPSQTPDKVDNLVKSYLEKLHKESGSANILK